MIDLQAIADDEFGHSAEVESGDASKGELSASPPSTAGDDDWTVEALDADGKSVFLYIPHNEMVQLALYILAKAGAR